MLPTATTAVDLRSALERMLGAHVLLTIELMRDDLAPSPAGRTQAALDAVGRNTGVLTGTIRSLYGAAAASRFAELWAAHVKELSDYADALYTNDAARAASAQAALTTTENDLGTLLAGATHGALSLTAARDAIRMHVQMLVDQARRYDTGDYAGAYAAEAEAFTHMTDLADTLARAIARSQGMPTTELDSPQRRLQAALDRLFALHMGLAVEAMRAAADDTPDFPAVGATLNDNSRALGQAVGVLYGQQAQAEFLQLWAQHVDALMAFATATRRHDRAGQDAARASLDRFAASMARFLATATHGRLPAVQLTGALTEHDSDLTTQLTAYAAGNFAAAEQTATTGYDHMFMLSETLATAIGSTVAARLPRGGAQTGGGGTAPRP